MKIPIAPKTDEEIQRHKFYGSIVSSLECLQDKIDDDEVRISNDEQLLKEKILEMDEKVRNLQHSEIEQLHSRINKKTYKDDFDHLKRKVDKLIESEVQNKTAWATGKTFIFGAWLVFTILFGWGYTMTQQRFDDYITTINKNDDKIVTMEAKVQQVEKSIDKTDIYHDNLDKRSDVLDDKLVYMDQSIKDLINKNSNLRSELGRIKREK